MQFYQINTNVIKHLKLSWKHYIRIWKYKKISQKVEEINTRCALSVNVRTDSTRVVRFHLNHSDRLKMERFMDRPRLTCAQWDTPTRDMISIANSRYHNQSQTSNAFPSRHNQPHYRRSCLDYHKETFSATNECFKGNDAHYKWFRCCWYLNWIFRKKQIYCFFMFCLFS